MEQEVTQNQPESEAELSTNAHTSGSSAISSAAIYVLVALLVAVLGAVGWTVYDKLTEDGTVVETLDQGARSENSEVVYEDFDPLAEDPEFAASGAVIEEGSQIEISHTDLALAGIAADAAAFMIDSYTVRYDNQMVQFLNESGDVKHSIEPDSESLLDATGVAIASSAGDVNFDGVPDVAILAAVKNNGANLWYYYVTYDAATEELIYLDLLPDFLAVVNPVFDAAAKTLTETKGVGSDVTQTRVHTFVDGAYTLTSDWQ